VVVEQVEDLDHLVAGQLPTGDIGLPALVGELRFKADQGRARALLRLREDETLAVQDAPDRPH
jgi:hypothetical protein